MPIKKGSTGIGAIYHGSTPIAKVYKGTTLVFSAGPVIEPPGDDLVVIRHVTAPVDGMFDLTGLDLTGYQRILVVADDLTVDTDDAAAWLHLYVDHELLISGYDWRMNSISSAGTDQSSTPTLGVAINLTVGTDTAAGWGIGNAAGESASFRVEISSSDTSNIKTVSMDGLHVRPDGSLVRTRGGGRQSATGRITGFSISGVSGEFTAGKVTVYGYPSTDRTPSPIAADLVSMWVGAVA